MSVVVKAFSVCVAEDGEDDYDAQVSQQFEDSPIAAGICRVSRNPTLNVKLHVDGQVLPRCICVVVGWCPSQTGNL